MISHFLKQGSVSDFYVDTFQHYNQALAQRLVEVYQSEKDNILICLPYQFKDASISKMKARVFWEREWLTRVLDLEKLGLHKRMGDTNFTRFYLDRKDIRDYGAYIAELQKIWAGREIVLVEGKFSRLGTGNTFFKNAKQIERIICPATDAFSKYETILNVVSKQDKSKLILIALGHTATVLAYDLALLGFQSIDVGHIDIEYEWYKIGATTKVSIPNKYVNEVSTGRITQASLDMDYEQQIIARVE